MEEYKESGIDWIGKIPKNWDIQPLGVCFDERREKVSDTLFEPLSVTKKGILKQLDNVAKSDAHDDRKKVCKDDFVINSRSDRKQSCGLSDYDGSVSLINTVLISNKKMLEPIFVKYLLDNCMFAEEFYRNGHGIVADLWTTNYTEMKRIYIPIPSKREQKKIASVLFNKVSKIDKILENLNKQVEILNNFKKSIITETVTKGLNKNVEYKDSKIEWIGIIPTNWKITYNKYIMKKIKNIKESYENENILSLTTNGVIIRDKDDNSGKLPASYDGYQIVKKGNLLMCLFDIDVTPRCVGLIKNNGLTSPAYSQFELINGNIANYYYYYYLMVDNTKELLHLAKNLRHSLTETDFGSIKTIQPPIEEQIEISNYLDKKCKKIDKTIQIKKNQIDKLENYKKSLIYEYVTGKKRVKEE